MMLWTEADEAKLQEAQARLRESAEKFGPLGRPADSSCACRQWPCPCWCHKRDKLGAGAS